MVKYFNLKVRTEEDPLSFNFKLEGQKRTTKIRIGDLILLDKFGYRIILLRKKKDKYVQLGMEDGCYGIYNNNIGEVFETIVEILSAQTGFMVKKIKVDDISKKNDFPDGYEFWKRR